MNKVPDNCNSAVGLAADSPVTLKGEVFNLLGLRQALPPDMGEIEAGN